MYHDHHLICNQFWSSVKLVMRLILLHWFYFSGINHICHLIYNWFYDLQMIVPMPILDLQLILLHGYNQLKGVFMQQMTFWNFINWQLTGFISHRINSRIDLLVIKSIVDQMAKVINSRKFEWITYIDVPTTQ